MKKLTCLLMSLLLIMLCTVVSAASLTNTDVVGVWYGDMFGITAVLTIKDDGTYQIENEDIAPYFGTWILEKDELLLDKGTENELALDIGEDSLTLSHIGLTVRFLREMPQQYIPAEARSDAAIEEFAGEWSMTHMSAGELWFYSNTVGVSVSLNISGTDALAFLYVDGNENYVLSVEAFSSALLANTDPGSYCTEMKGVLENGVLTLTEVLPDSVSTEGTYEEAAETSVPVVWEVRLLEDGILCVTENTDPLLPLTYYMTPIMPLTIE